MSYSIGEVHSFQEYAAPVFPETRAIGTLLTQDPAHPADDTWWLVRDGATPQNVRLKVRVAGVTSVVLTVAI